MIEVVAGQALDEYLTSTIFHPLDMVDTGFYVPPDKVGRLAAVYGSVAGVPQWIDNDETHEITQHIPLLSGGGGCASTVLDYLRFARMLQGRGELDGVRLLEPETVDLMTRNHVAAPQYPIQVYDHLFEGEGYGLGVGVIVEPGVAAMAGSAGTYEWAGGWNTHFMIDPVKELIGIFMAQYEPFDFEGLGHEYWSLVCQALID